MQVRCPQCRSQIKIAEESSFREIVCSTCDRKFSLIGGTDDTESDRSGHRSIAHFTLVDRLGIGAFGTVWKAKDSQLDRFVAIKIPRKEQLSSVETEQFLREARASAQLKHENIVRVHEVGRDEDGIYIVSDYVEGATLKEMLGGQPLPPRESAEIATKIADALQHAHDRGVIHRDLKPGNVMVDLQGQPHVLDFGLAKRESGEITMTLDGALIGTPAYMSPEQARGEGHHADRRSDVYSLGVILFEMLTGELPYRGEKRILLVKILSEEPPSLRSLKSEIPKDLETICLKCLEKEPAIRYQSAAEVADELRRFLRGEPIEARSIGTYSRTVRWAKRNPVVSVLAGTLLLVLVAFAVGGPLVAVKQAGLKQEAEESRTKAETLLYTSDINSGFDALRDGNLRRLRDLLLRQIPANSDRVTDLRCFAWYFLLKEYLNEIAEPVEFRTGVDSLAFIPHSDDLVVGLNDGSVILLHHQDLHSSRPLLDPLNGADENRAFSQVAVSVDGSRLFVGRGLEKRGSEVSGQVLVLSLPDGDLIERIEVAFPVSALALSGDQSTLVAGGLNGEVKAWECEGYESIANLTPHTDKVSFLAFGDANRELYTTSYDARSKCIDLATGTEQFDLPGHRLNVTSIALSPDHEQLVTTSWLRVRFWERGESRDWKLIDQLPFSAERACYSPDGKLIATSHYDHLIRFWDRNTRRQVKRLIHQPVVSSIAFNQNGDLFSSGSVNETLKLWKMRETIKPQPILTSVQGRLGLESANNVVAVSGPDHGVLIWDLKTGTKSEHRGVHTDLVVDLAFSPDGRSVATASLDGTAAIWDTVSGKVTRTFPRQDSSVNGVAYLPDGKAIVTCSVDGEAIVWNCQTGEIRERLIKTQHPLTSVAVSPEGVIACGGGVRHRSGNVYLFEANQGTYKRLDPLIHPDWVRCLAFSPVERVLAVGDYRNARLWTLDDRTFQILNAGHAVSAISFTEDGKTLATTGGVQVKLWHVASAEEMGTIETGEELEGVTFVESGMVTASEEGNVQLWEVADKAEVGAFAESRD